MKQPIEHRTEPSAPPQTDINGIVSSSDNIVPPRIENVVVSFYMICNFVII